MEWVGTIEGAEGTPYEGHRYRLALKFGSDYPFRPPVVRFETACFHPNVDQYGNITDTPPDPTEKEEINAEDIELGIPKKEKIEGDEIREGIVSFFNHDKGFGFIRDLGSGESIFVHINNVNGDELNENNRVTFEVEQGPRGLAAIKVSKA